MGAQDVLLVGSRSSSCRRQGIESLEDGVIYQESAGNSSLRQDFDPLPVWGKAARLEGIVGNMKRESALDPDTRHDRKVHAS